MPDVNDLIISPGKFFLRGRLTLDPGTVIQPTPQYQPPTTSKTMTVADGGVVKLYDVTDPSNPILIGTVG